MITILWAFGSILLLRKVTMKVASFSKFRKFIILYQVTGILVTTYLSLFMNIKSVSKKGFIFDHFDHVHIDHIDHFDHVHITDLTPASFLKMCFTINVFLGNVTELFEGLLLRKHFYFNCMFLSCRVCVSEWIHTL